MSEQGASGSGAAIRVTDEGAVRRLTLCRPEAYNTITPQLRDELGAAAGPATQALYRDLLNAT